MAKHRFPAVALAIFSGLLAGCTAGAEPATTTTLQATTTTPPAVTSTTAPESTTTTSGAPADEYLPSARSRDDVPWGEVGNGWYVVIYDTSKAYPETPEEQREGIKVLYLVSSDGDLFEITTWGVDEYPFLVDATPSTALVTTAPADASVTRYEVVDLATGASSVAHTVDFAENARLDTWPLAYLTRPSGQNVVVHRADEGTEWLERRTADGNAIATVFEQPYNETETGLSWLYEPDGTSLVVATTSAASRVSNLGERLGPVWTPEGHGCRLVRWWDEETVLAVCNPIDAGYAPTADDGQLHLYYDRLWLLPTDGSAGTDLTPLPVALSVSDFGYRDAWRTDEASYLQWGGECGAGKVARLDADGITELAAPQVPDVYSHGWRLLDVRNDNMTLHVWEDCAAWSGVLVTTDLEGVYQETLVPIVADTRGVADVIPLSVVHP